MPVCEYRAGGMRCVGENNRQFVRQGRRKEAQKHSPCLHSSRSINVLCLPPPATSSSISFVPCIELLDALVVPEPLASVLSTRLLTLRLSAGS